MSKELKPFEIILLGAPASGKGTQVELLTKTLGIPHISTGALLSKIKNDPSHELGREIAQIMNRGGFVPDNIVNSILLKRLQESDCRFGFVLEGYPRTLKQAEFLADKTDIDFVFLIDVPDIVAVRRIAGRRICPNGHSFHIEYAPSKKGEICDVCGEKLSQRDDDTEEVIRARLDLFHKESAPIIEFYRKKGLLHTINGDASIDQVFQGIVKEIVWDLRRKLMY